MPRGADGHICNVVATEDAVSIVFHVERGTTLIHSVSLIEVQPRKSFSRNVLHWGDIRIILPIHTDAEVDIRTLRDGSLVTTTVDASVGSALYLQVSVRCNGLVGEVGEGNCSRS